MRSTILKMLTVCLLVSGVFSAQAGLALRVFYDELPAGVETVDGLLNDTPHFPAGPNPTIGILFTQLIATGSDNPEFDIFDDAVDNFGTCVRAFVEIPEDGDYRFFIASDDPSRLEMADPSDPSNHNTASVVAEETGCCTDLFSGARLSARSTDAMTLSKGDKLYFTYYHVEIGGDSWVQLGWQKPDGTQQIVPADHLTPFHIDMDGNGSSTIPSEVAPFIPSTYGHEGLPVPANPTSITVTEGRRLSIPITYVASQPATIEWSKDGASAIAGQNLSVFSKVAQTSDSGTYVATISNPAGSVSTSGTIVTIEPDTEPPTLLSATGSGNPHGIIVNFSEPVDEASATDPSNYSFTGQSLTVNNARLLDEDSVLLEVTEFNTDPLTVNVSGVQDRAGGNTIADGSSVVVNLRGQGLISLFYEYPGGGLGGFYPDPRGKGDFPPSPNPFGANPRASQQNVQNRQSSIIGYWESPNTGDINTAPPGDVNDNYGQVMHGLLIPQVTADYTFAIAVDDNAELWLSTDEDPANTTLIANEPQWNTARDYDGTDGNENISAPQSLVAGEAYAVEMVTQEGGGGDNAAVAWTTDGTVPPDGSNPIPGEVLFHDIETGPIAIAQHPQDQTVTENRTAMFSAQATSDHPNAIGYQWFRDGNRLTGETGTTLTVGPVAQADDGAEFTVQAYNVNGTFNVPTSDPAILNVDTDVTPPGFEFVMGVPTRDAVTVRFNEQVDPDTLGNAANYSIAAAASAASVSANAGGGAIAVNNAVLYGDGRSVLLETDAFQADTLYTLTAENIDDIAVTPNTFSGSQNFMVARQLGGLTVQLFEDDTFSFDPWYPPPRGQNTIPDTYNMWAADPLDNLTAVQNRQSSIATYAETPNSGDILIPPPGDVIDNYGQVMWGWFVPERTGNYRFAITTDDNSELYLGTSEDPSSAQLIASEPEWNGVRLHNDTAQDTDMDGRADNKSEVFALEAGQRYSIEAVMFEGGGGDNMAVAYQFSESGDPPAFSNGDLPIAGNELESYMPVNPRATLTIASALTKGNPNGLDVQWSAAVDEASATNPDNYSISVAGAASAAGAGGGITVNSATLLNETTVRLETSEIARGQVYTVTANNVQDAVGIANATDVSADFVQVHGVIERRQFNDVGGVTLAELQSSPKFPDNPDIIDYRSALETPPNVRDNYGVQFVGTFTAMKTGPHVFHISGDDNAGLWLGTSEDPSTKMEIATEPQWANPREWTGAAGGRRGTVEGTERLVNVSAPMDLVAGESVYIEAQMNEAGGGDNLAVAVVEPGDDPIENGDPPIQGRHLSTLDSFGPVEIATPPQDQTATELLGVTFSVEPAGSPFYNFQWMKDGSPISGATTRTLTMPSALLSDNGADITVEVSNAFSSATSAAATLTVNADEEGPLVIRRGESFRNQDIVNVSFSEPVEQSSAENPANYEITHAGGTLAVNNATLAANQTMVTLETGPQTAGTRYTVTVNNVTDLAAAANPVAAPDNVAIFFGIGGIVQVGGMVVFEVEDHDRLLGTIWTRATSRGNPSGGAYMWIPHDSDDSEAADVLEYDVEFTETGIHIVWYRAGGDDGDDDSAWFHFDGARPPNRTAGNEASMTGFSGDTFSWNSNPQDGDSPFDFDVPTAGQHVVGIAAREDGANFDKMVITTDPDFVPSGLGPQPTYEGIPPLPEISITSPAEGATFASGADVPIEVEITSPAGDPTLVEFFANGTKIGESTSDPFSFTWTGAADGRYSLTAQVTNDILDTGTSAAVNIGVGELPPLAVFVVGDLNLNASDAGVRDQLESLGLDVQLVHAPVSQSSDADGADVVVISSTVSSGDVGDKFQSSVVPVVQWEQALQDNFLMTGDVGDTDRGSVGGQTSLTLVGDAHPLAAGLSAGDHDVVTEAAEFAWGLPGDEATRIAHIPGNADQVAIYGYDTGAALIDGTPAPARRVHIFFTDNTFAVLNDNGLDLFNAAIGWALDQDITPQEAEFTGISTDASGNVVLEWEGGGTLQKGETANGPWSDVAGATSPFTYTPEAGETEAYFRIAL